MKLELKHLAPYLPYNIKVLHSSNCIMFMVSERKKGPYLSLEGVINYGKPILHHISDITKEIEVNGQNFVPGEELSNLIDENGLGYNDYYYNYNNKKYEIENPLSEPYFVVEKLLEWHFDLFNLIENGIAIDINKLKK